MRFDRVCHMARFFKAFIFFLTFPIAIYPQYQNIKFEHLSIEHGLSHTTVRCVFQGSGGFMWFGTEDGLNKFDGYKFTRYRHDAADSTTLSNNEIRYIYEDLSDQLWIATAGGGINKFDHETERFIHYTYDRNNPASIPSNFTKSMTSFKYDDKEIIWIGTSQGLSKFDPESEQFILFQHTDKKYPFSSVESTVVDSAGKVWIGTMRDGLHRFDPEIGRFTSFRHDPDSPHSLGNNRAYSLLMDKSGILWVGTTGGGLNKFNPEDNRFIRYQNNPKDRLTLSNDWIASIYEDQSGILWVGTAVGGLNILDRQTEKFTSYIHDPGDPNSISDNTVQCIFEDEGGVLWVGTWGGINKIDPRKTKFTDIKHHPGDSNSLSGNWIWSICESNDEGKPSLWIGTKTDGLNKLDLTNGKIERIIHKPGNPNSIPSNYIFTLCNDRSGLLWIGTYGNGLIKYDQKSKKYFLYKHEPDNPGSISGNIILRVIEDSFGKLWIGTNARGLNRLDKETDQFSWFLQNLTIMDILEDKLGNLWIAGGMLIKMDRETEQFTYYRHNPNDSSSISSNSTLAIYETTGDGQQVLWVGTNGGGLNRFDSKSEKFKNYTIDDGLPSNVINGILEDNDGNLWLSTHNGFSRFNPRSEIFRNYDVADGLLSNKFNFRVCCKTTDGQMFFGSTKGVNAFYPDRLTDNLHIPEIVITDFQLFNEPVGIKKNNNTPDEDNYFLEKNISELRDIELSYRESIFSFEFAALDYAAPEKNKYAYKMEGVDPEWVFTDASRRFATYTNLDPGEYIFRVRGSNNDGIWNEEGTSINIVITPPWWRTNLAYAFYLLLFGSVVFATWRAQLRRIRVKQQLKMEHFEAEKLREVDQLKSHFFANISHEFRTPLTLIKGPVKQIFDGEFAGNLKEQCKMILRNSDRLLELINQLLDLSKFEAGEIKLQVAETDIIHYLKGMVLTFLPLAESKKVTLKFTSSENVLTGYIDRDKLEKIATNLLSNAFKFTPEYGKIEIKICRGMACHAQINNVIPAKAGIHKKNWIPHQVRDDNGEKKSQLPITNSDFVEIKITNTGPGISSDQLDKIFDRFYQAGSTYKKDSEGTGIGLALTKELVELCHGEIAVSSIPNKTTTFIVTLPITKECFKENEVVERMETADRRPQTEKPIKLIDNPPDSGLLSPVFENQSPASSLRSPLVLVVEDNPDVTEYISSFMKNDFRLITTENGKEGLKKTLDKYPDLIISDIMMPEMDGFEFCQKVKSDERISHIPIILLTAKADLDSKIEGLEFGADDYVTKPFESRELQIRAKNLIEQRRKLRDKFSSLIDLKPEDISASSMDEQLLQRLLAIFEDHIEEPDFNLEHLSHEIGMSRTHLNRKIQAMTNLSTSDFIRTLRLQRAARLLRGASGTVSEIAYKVGFNNLSYFSKAFRKHFGKLPSDFLRKQ